MTATLRTPTPSLRLLAVLLLLSTACQGAESATAHGPSGTGVIAGGNVVPPDVAVSEIGVDSSAVEAAAPASPEGAAPDQPTPPPAPELNVYAATLPGDWSPLINGMPELVYVPSSDSNTLWVIDPHTFTVIDHYPVGRVPHHVTPAWDLQTLFVDNTAGNSLTPIDPRTGKRVGNDIPITDPYNLYFTFDGRWAIVVAERENRLDFYDPRTWQLDHSIGVAHTGVDHLDFSADGTQLLASCEFSGFVVRVDLNQMKVTGELQVGGSPIDVKLSPDGAVYYVANQDRDGVSVIDPVAMTETAFIPTGKGAHGLYPSRDTRFLYVTNRKAGSVSVIDFATRQLAATWNVGGSPDMGSVSPDGRYLWLTSRFASDVLVIDTTTGTLATTIKVGPAPHGLAYFPQPGRLSLGHTGVYR